DPERLVELVVAVVRVAPRTGIRMLLRLRLRSVTMLDRDVDPRRRHWPILDSGPFRPSYRPRARVSLDSGSTFDGSKLNPVRPAPKTVVRSRISIRKPSSWATERPSGSGMKTESSEGSATSASTATYVHLPPT